MVMAEDVWNTQHTEFHHPAFTQAGLLLILVGLTDLLVIREAERL